MKFDEIKLPKDYWQNIRDAKRASKMIIPHLLQRSLEESKKVPVHEESDDDEFRRIWSLEPKQ